MTDAKYVCELTVIDPDTYFPVKLEVYKHKYGGIFAVDSSFLDSCFENEDEIFIPNIFHNDPLATEAKVKLSK